MVDKDLNKFIIGELSFKKWAKPGLFLLIFLLFRDKYSTHLTINDFCRDSVVRARTRGGRMVSADKSTELYGIDE